MSNVFADVLEHFQQWNPFLVEQMKNCSHHYRNNSLNPYHLEGDVWSHSMMVLNNMRPENSYTGAITALCHDIGKIYTRSIKNPNRVSFHGHGYASVQDTIDFAYYLNDEIGIELSSIFKFVLPVISNHMELYDENTSIEKMFKLCNENITTSYIAYYLGKADSLGSIGKRPFDGDKLQKFNEFFDYVNARLYEYSPSKEEAPDFILHCGLPASGKDTLADANKVSYDGIRVEKFLESHPIYFHYHPSDVYSAAFKWCNDVKLDLNVQLKRQMEEKFENGDTPITICNVNLTKKARRSIINLCRQIKKDAIIHCKMICCPFNMAVEIDNRRIEKNVGVDVIERFARNIQVPTKQEGFDKVEFLTR